jgi:hypothetical protein
MQKSITLLNNVEHWKARASEARRLAEGQPDAQLKRTMLDIAAEFDVFARRAEYRRQSENGSDAQ